MCVCVVCGFLYFLFLFCSEPVFVAKLLGSLCKAKKYVSIYFFCSVLLLPLHHPSTQSLGGFFPRASGCQYFTAVNDERAEIVLDFSKKKVVWRKNIKSFLLERKKWNDIQKKFWGNFFFLIETLSCSLILFCCVFYTEILVNTQFTYSCTATAQFRFSFFCFYALVEFFLLTFTKKLQSKVVVEVMYMNNNNFTIFI